VIYFDISNEPTPEILEHWRSGEYMCIQHNNKHSWRIHNCKVDGAEIWLDYWMVLK